MTVERDDSTNPHTWGFTCPEPTGCGGEDGPFTSLGWPRKADAVARGAQHAAEHEACGQILALQAEHSRAVDSEGEDGYEGRGSAEVAAELESVIDEARMPELADFEGSLS